MSINKVIVEGNIGNDLELNNSEGKRSMVRLSLATNDRYIPGVDRDKTPANWHPVVVFGKQAEALVANKSKGDSIRVEGRIENSSYTDKDGVKRYNQDVIPQRVEFGPKNGSSMDVNLCILQGFLGEKPELKTTKSGTPMCILSLATDDGYMKDGTYVDNTTWHRVAVFGDDAGPCAEHLEKGQMVTITGKRESVSYTDKDGVKRYTMNIKASSVSFGPKSKKGRPEAEAAPATQGFDESFDDDEIPF